MKITLSKKQWNDIGKKAGWSEEDSVSDDPKFKYGPPSSSPENVYVDANGKWAFQLPHRNSGTLTTGDKPWYEAQKELKKDLLNELTTRDLAGDYEISLLEDLLALTKIRG